MELYGSLTSPFVRHCRIALTETQQSFEFIDTNPAMSAKLSPTQKVPFLKDADLTLTDSSSILKYIREKANQAFFSDIQDFELYCMTNTLLDSAINSFLMYRFDKITADASTYLQRQQRRLITGLSELNTPINASPESLTDGQLRLACFLEYGLFRQLISLEDFEHLRAFLSVAKQYALFVETSPPQE